MPSEGNKMRALPFFDAHNHIHLGPTSPRVVIDHLVGGLALMSTHPRDFPVVSRTVRDLSDHCPDADGACEFVPCFGVHPWFLHEVDVPQTEWMREVRRNLEMNPRAAVGEVGLDGARYSPDTGELVSKIEDQTRAFEAQMRVACEFRRAVSIHAVKCWAPLTKTLERLKRDKRLPPRIYFHAFGGKAPVVDQITALLRREETEIFFGFAPCINFRSPKTADVVRKVGIERIVLETDREDASFVSEEIRVGAEFVADSLDLPLEAVVTASWDNARRLYDIL